MLNGLLTSLYVLTGSLGGLVPFIGTSHPASITRTSGVLTIYPGVTEFSFFLASVVGLLLLRREDAVRPSPARYRTWSGNPFIFCGVSTLLITRTMITQPLLGLGVVGAGLAGLGVFRAKVQKGLN